MQNTLRRKKNISESNVIMILDSYYIMHNNMILNVSRLLKIILDFRMLSCFFWNPTDLFTLLL